jgi:hypothetical protein
LGVALGAALTVAAVTALEMPSASALTNPPNKVAIGKDAITSARCALTVVKVDVPSYTTRVRLGAQEYPTNLDGYSRIAFTQPFCSVYDSAGNLLTTFNPFKNAPARPWVSVAVDLPYGPFYTLCATGFVKLKNGDTDITPMGCS